MLFILCLGYKHAIKFTNTNHHDEYMETYNKFGCNEVLQWVTARQELLQRYNGSLLLLA